MFQGYAEGFFKLLIPLSATVCGITFQETVTFMVTALRTSKHVTYLSWSHTIKCQFTLLLYSTMKCQFTFCISPPKILNYSHTFHFLMSWNISLHTSHITPQWSIQLLHIVPCSQDDISSYISTLCHGKVLALIGGPFCMQFKVFAYVMFNFNDSNLIIPTSKILLSSVLTW